MYEMFWMAVGAIASWFCTHLYHNKKFKEAFDEEVASAKSKLKAKLN